jgi:Ca2+-binding EF-hand superfamily protein
MIKLMKLKLNDPMVASLAIGTLLFATSCATTDPADTNKDGILSVPELESAMVDAIINYSDQNRDGQLTFAEWQAANSKADASLFHKRDLNGDGKVDRAEAIKSTSDSDLWARLIAKIDLDGDGIIDESEKSAFRAEMAKGDQENQVNRLIEITNEE